MSRTLTRRDFLVTTGAAVALGSRLSARQSSAKLRHAVIGCSGQGGADLSSIAKHPAVDIVALCDVDANNLARAAKRFPNAKQYRDYRVMFKEMGSGIDTVNIGIPDHMHAAPAVMAMNLGKHVYVQKPLTHDVYESRRLAEIAREKKVQSQMGIQVHSSQAYRTGVRLIRDGVIGRVKEVHSWSNKKWGFDGPRPAGADPIPPNLEWDIWLGTAPERPYKADIYHPGDWRRWTDFGCGTMGDMSIHILDPVAGALGLTAPTTIISDSDPPPAESFATRNKVRYTFPGTPQTVDPFHLTWYDGDAVPSTEGWPIDALPSQGSMFLGEKGFMLLPHTAMPRLYPEETFKTFEIPKVEGLNHWFTWLDACLGTGGTPSANFDYSAPLTEFVLLGVVANRVPGVTLTWHAKDMHLAGSDKAAALLRRTYRTGWEVPGL